MWIVVSFEIYKREKARKVVVLLNWTGKNLNYSTFIEDNV